MQPSVSNRVTSPFAWLRLAWAASLAATVTVACVPPPTSPPAGLDDVGALRPPHKPGESLTKSQQCTCVACEPRRCCHELEEDAPSIDPKCANGYDFSKCEMAVQSCDSRCFRHRWRAPVSEGCAATRPPECCHDQPAF